MEVISLKIIFKESIAGPNYAYSPGDSAEFEEKQAIRFCEAGIAYPTKEKQVETASFPKHTGGGWYELSDGSKVQGKEEAIAAEKKLGG